MRLLNGTNESSVLKYLISGENGAKNNQLILKGIEILMEDIISLMKGNVTASIERDVCDCAFASTILIESAKESDKEVNQEFIFELFSFIDKVMIFHYFYSFFNPMTLYFRIPLTHLPVWPFHL